MERAVRHNAAEPISDGIDAGDESFTACLNRHLRQSELSLTALARRSWLGFRWLVLRWVTLWPEEVSWRRACRRTPTSQRSSSS